VLPGVIKGPHVHRAALQGCLTAIVHRQLRRAPFPPPAGAPGIERGDHLPEDGAVAIPLLLRCADEAGYRQLFIVVNEEDEV